jgi:hypothetical protein
MNTNSACRQVRVALCTPLAPLRSFGKQALLRFICNLCFCAIVAGGDQPIRSSFAAGPERPNTQLLLDGRLVQSIEGVRLRLGRFEKSTGNPLFGADQPWEVRMDNLYPNVIFDPSTRQYGCWYSPFIVDPATTNTSPEKRRKLKYLDVLNRAADKREMALCYATSTDGIHWKKPALGFSEYRGSTQNNIVLRLPAKGPHGSGVFRDAHEMDPARRFKAFYSFNHGLQWTGSPDGMHWNPPVDCSGVQVPGDTHNCLLWAPTIGKYVAFTRTWDRVRQVARTESADLKTWTPAEVALQGTDPQHQTYTIQVFQYAGVYLGLLMVLDVQNDTVQCELAWSPDTRQWHRVCPGQALIHNGRPGSCDSGCVYASSPILWDDRIELYYGGSNGQHGQWRDSFLCRGELLPDRWAGYEPTKTDSSGHVITRQLRFAGRELFVSADAAKGSITISVLGNNGDMLAESQPISADVTDSKIVWKQHDSLERQVGRDLRLRFEITNAALYAFRFGGRPEPN